jgi:uncharacterized caspase-like protein
MPDGVLLADAYALVVGIDEYRHVRKLPATSDAADIHAALVDAAGGAYPPTNVTLLVNEQATQSSLRAALADLAERVPADGTLFVFFSGHGARLDGDTAGAGDYLLPVDADPTTPQTLAASAIAGSEFNALLRAIPARKGVVVLDCCHAAGIGEAKGLVPDLPLSEGLSDGLYDALKAGRGRVVYASSRGDESSYVLPGARNGVFTEQLLAGLRGGVASADGYVRVFDLFEYLQPRVTAAQPLQHPVFKAEVEENFAVARYRGGTKGTVALDEQGFRYDAYLSYVDRAPDATWVWDTLLPQLEAAGLRVAVAGDSESAGVARLVNIERGITQARRTVLLLSPDYLADNMADFTNVLAQTLGVEEGAYRLLPMKIAALDDAEIPLRLRMLATLDVTHPRRGPGAIDRLIAALREPVPQY